MKNFLEDIKSKAFALDKNNNSNDKYRYNLSSREMCRWLLNGGPLILYCSRDGTYKIECDSILEELRSKCVNLNTEFSNIIRECNFFSDYYDKDLFLCHIEKSVYIDTDILLQYLLNGSKIEFHNSFIGDKEIVEISKRKVISQIKRDRTEKEFIKENGFENIQLRLNEYNLYADNDGDYYIVYACDTTSDNDTPEKGDGWWSVDFSFSLPVELWWKLNKAEMLSYYLKHYS